MTDGFGRFTSAISFELPGLRRAPRLAETIYEEHGRMLGKKGTTRLYRKFTRHRHLGLRVGGDPTLARDGPVDRLVHDSAITDISSRGSPASASASRPSQQGHPNLRRVFRNKYGLSEDAIEFWTTHAEDDIEHGRRSF